MEAPTRFVDLIQRMDKDELADALQFVEACERGGNMRPEEAAKYRRHISHRLAFLHRIRLSLSRRRRGSRLTGN
jgi:hypothetical protein